MFKKWFNRLKESFNRDLVVEGVIKATKCIPTKKLIDLANNLVDGPQSKYDFMIGFVACLKMLKDIPAELKDEFVNSYIEKPEAD